MGLPSKSNAFGKPRGSRASSARENRSSKTFSPIRPDAKLRSSSRPSEPYAFAELLLYFSYDAFGSSTAAYEPGSISVAPRVRSALATASRAVAAGSIPPIRHDDCSA